MKVRASLQLTGQETYQLYGALYNYPARQQWPLCPSQWSVPTDEDWFELESHLGMEAPTWMSSVGGADQGTELKSTTMAGMVAAPAPICTASRDCPAAS